MSEVVVLREIQDWSKNVLQVDERDVESRDTKQDAEEVLRKLRKFDRKGRKMDRNLESVDHSPHLREGTIHEQVQSGTRDDGRLDGSPGAI